MAIDTLQFLNGVVTQGNVATNAISTATVGAVLGCRTFLTGIKADFGAAVAAGFTLIQVKFGTTVVLNILWDTTKVPSPLWFGFPGHIHGDYNQAVSVELAASGVGGVNGRVALHSYTI